MAKKKRSFRRLIVIVFVAAFVASGGWKIFSPQTWQNIGELLPRKEFSAAANESGTQDISFFARAERLIFLKRAVNARLRKENFVPFDDMSPLLRQAIVAVEDGRFYEHSGFDIESIARASLVNLQYGSIEEGASTITQQLAKNLFLSAEQSFDRKAEELLLALSLEANYDKDEILELYLNTIYFGSGYYGIKPAAEGYFAKEPADLSLAEAAMLAGVPNAPSVYSPYVDFIMAKKRQMIVLDAMVRAGFITKEVAEDAKIKPIYLAH